MRTHAQPRKAASPYDLGREGEMGFTIADAILRFPALIIALVFHEYAHALVADALGDRTPRYTGRLTLNPLAHLDPVGLISLWLFRFGWAKPVRVNPYNFRDSRKGMLLVGIAGPAMNFLLALVALAAFKVLRVPLWGLRSGAAVTLARMLVMYNVWLLVFNIIPIPPLDGSRVLSGLLPWRFARYLEELEGKGWIILLVLVWTGFIGRIMFPLELGVLRILDALTSFL